MLLRVSNLSPFEKGIYIDKPATSSISALLYHTLPIDIQSLFFFSSFFLSPYQMYYYNDVRATV